MWLELTDTSIANATAKAREHHRLVRRISDTEISVPCSNEAHPEGHVTRFERRGDGSLWGECILRHTGEECPAVIGHYICYHLSAGVVLFFALESMRAGEDRAGATEHAVMFGGALPQPVIRPRETVNEYKVLGRVIRDRRINGIAI